VHKAEISAFSDVPDRTMKGKTGGASGFSVGHDKSLAHFFQKPSSPGRTRCLPAISCDAGFRPGSRAPLVSAKGAKAMLTVAWPFGSPARFGDFGGAQTRGACPETSRRAQTVPACPPKSPARLGHATRPEETSSTIPAFVKKSALAASRQGLTIDQSATSSNIPDLVPCLLPTEKPEEPNR
jgi:hypothetical protein